MRCRGRSPLLTVDESASVAYLTPEAAHRSGGIREQDPFPENVEPVVEGDEDYWVGMM